MSFLDKIFRGPSPQQRAIDEYNKGLKAKYEGKWQESLEHNQRAAESNPNDEATWWNLAIAATALHNWTEARRAWIAFGITPNESEGEVTTQEGWACVRLCPDGVGEVVWGKRIDPARMRVMNVPLPESDRLYGDIILNDGAPEGNRISNGREYPVFNELAVWKRSEFSTFRVEVSGSTSESLASLERLCQQAGMHFEDWGTVRILCAACSRGNPGPHECAAIATSDSANRMGIAAKNSESVSQLLKEWVEIEPEISVGPPELLVCGVSQ